MTNSVSLVHMYTRTLTDTHGYRLKYFLILIAWRVSSAGPIIIGLFAVSLISRSTDSKLHTLYTQAHEALKNQTSHSFFLLMSYFIQFFFDYDALTPSTYPSYAVAFFIGFITCYFMIFLADKENNNGAHTFSLFPFKKDRRNVNGL